MSGVFFNGTDLFPQPLLSHKNGMSPATVQANDNQLCHVVKKHLRDAKNCNALSWALLPEGGSSRRKTMCSFLVGSSPHPEMLHHLHPVTAVSSRPAATVAIIYSHSAAASWGGVIVVGTRLAD